MRHIGIIGTGFMGSAIVRAIRTAHNDVQFGMIEKDGSKRDFAMRELGTLDFTSKPDELFGFAEVVFLAVKPQDLPKISAQIGAAGRNANVVSMLAGTSIASVQSAFGTSIVTRIMPNLAADIGKAVTGIAFSSEVSTADRASIRDLLSGVGTLIEVDESLIGAVTGISGSGIAFVLRFVEALAMAGVEQGIPFAQSLEAARDVVESAALLLKATEEHPAELVSRVCSPGGTTIRGIRALEEGRFSATVMSAVEAATKRALEFEK